MTRPEARRAAAHRVVAIPDRLYFKIGDVARLLGVKPYVLRYWETEFKIVTPEKSKTGRRVYRRSDVEALVMVRKLLYEERYSIEGARKRINELRGAGDLRDFKREANQSGERARQLNDLLAGLDRVVDRGLALLR